MKIKALVSSKLTWVVFNTDNPSIPEVNWSEPDFCTIASVVCFSDPSLKPNTNKAKDLRTEKKQTITIIKSRIFNCNTNWVQRLTKADPLQRLPYMWAPSKTSKLQQCIIVWLTMFMRLTIHNDTLPWFFHNIHNSTSNLQKSKNFLSIK